MAAKEERSLGNVTMEGVELLGGQFRNFTGREGKYNREGDRQFSVILPPDVAEEMYKDGWNVKTLASREEGEPDIPFLTIAVNYSRRPPRVVMITSRGHTALSENEVDLLDSADIRYADLIVRPRPYDVNGTKGVKAYLKALYVTIEEDELDLKYADLDVPTRSGKIDE